jgi:hypothetical protein
MSKTERGIVRPLEIDLRGKSFEELLQQIRESGYVAVASQARVLDKQSATQEEDKQLSIHLLWVNSKKSANITVVDFTGSELVLEPEAALCFFSDSESQSNDSVLWIVETKIP